jgi:hypothetical protein
MYPSRSVCLCVCVLVSVALLRALCVAWAGPQRLHVFASCDRPTVLHASAGRLFYSNVNVRVCGPAAPPPPPPPGSYDCPAGSQGERESVGEFVKELWRTRELCAYKCVRD